MKTTMPPQISMRALTATLFTCSLALLTSCTTQTTASPRHLYGATDGFRKRMAQANARGLMLTDYHIHIRGGMTPEKAAERQQHSGIRSAVLENHGQAWPLSDHDKLAAFLTECRKPKVNGQPLLVGIQVNDRDWHKTMDPALLGQLDFVLADSMIMGVKRDGTPCRLWEPDVTIPDPEQWMERYVAHNLRILDEPISILANPTYLPACIAERYDDLWTEARMRQVIEKAVKRGVALEIQAESAFPKPAFLKLAKAMGATFSFGTNNFDDQVKDLSRWFEAIDLLDIKPADVWSPKDCKTRP